MRLAHLTASTFFGGPERQMLGLAECLAPDDPVTFLSFAEGGRCEAFLEHVRAAGFTGTRLDHDSPHVRSGVRELADRFRSFDAVLCHGYKANLLGRVAARRVGIPAVAVSRGWTGENRKVRAYEWLDRRHLRWMDHVVAVSDGQADKVRRAGVPASRLTVIRNSARLKAFASVDASYRERLHGYFPGDAAVRVVAAAGRLSPEKGFTLFVDAAKTIIDAFPAARFVLFGEGAERAAIESRIRELGLGGKFVLAGFRGDLDAFLPWADVMVQTSFTEGMPNVLLEASAAGVPSVATAVGGSAEVVADGETGILVKSGDVDAVAAGVLSLLRDDDRRGRFGKAARQKMRDEFTFESQARGYRDLLARLARPAVLERSA